MILSVAMPQVSFKYAQDTNTVFAALTNPDNVKACAEALGDKNVRVDLQESGATKTTICTRDVEAALPKFAKKLFNPVNEVVERREWREDGDRKACAFHVDVKGTPATIAGTITLSPEGAGCKYDVNFDVTAKVPLIRKKLEEFVGGVTADGFRDEHGYYKKTLGSEA